MSSARSSAQQRPTAKNEPAPRGGSQPPPPQQKGTQQPDPKKGVQPTKQTSGGEGFDPSPYVKPGLNAEDVLKIKECFDIFDYDKSGAITPNELKNAILALGLDKSAEEILNLVNDLDQDGNNEVNFEEFLQIFGFTGELTDEEVLKDLFNQFDEDKDGLITVDDFKRINDLVGERYTEIELKEMVEYADKDKDNKINWDEFKAVVLREYGTN